MKITTTNVVLSCLLFSSALQAAPQRRPAPRRIVVPARRPVRVIRASPIAATARVVAHLLKPPKNHVVVVVGGRSYYRSGTLFYRTSIVDGRTVYIRTVAPAGAVVSALPDNPEVVVVNGQTYFKADSAFYQAQATPADSSGSPSYVVVRPPAGTVVQELPPGAVAQYDQGNRSYIADGTKYLQITVSGDTRYVVIP